MSLFTRTHRLVAACARGAAPFLAAELKALGLPVLAERDGAVETEGTMADAMRMNLHLRTAQRVHLVLARFECDSPDDLYRRVQGLPWEEIVPGAGYLTVDSFVRTPSVTDTRFAALRCKDAIVDRIRRATGRRPDSGNERRGAVVYLYWSERQVIVHVDTSGESLARRGYRRIPMDAPMQEPLAAAAVLASEWGGRGHFVNPMCGSGTLAIEAALLGQGRAPGLLRARYAFMHLVGYDDAAWQALRSAARAQPKRKIEGRIIATDIRPEAVRAAEQNARTAGVERLIEFGACDFAATTVPEGGPGVVFLNPEYGERMGQLRELEPLYGRIGDFFKQRCQGYTGYVFTGNLDLAKRIGLRTTRRILFFNGPIECRLLAFGLYRGTRRTFSPRPETEGPPPPAESGDVTGV